MFRLKRYPFNQRGILSSMKKLIKFFILFVLAFSLPGGDKVEQKTQDAEYTKLINQYAIINRSIFRLKLYIDLAESENDSTKVNELKKRIEEKQKEKAKIKDSIMALKKPNESIVYIEGYEEGNLLIRERHPEIPSNEELKKIIKESKTE